MFAWYMFKIKHVYDICQKKTDKFLSFQDEYANNLDLLHIIVLFAYLFVCLFIYFC